MKRLFYILCTLVMTAGSVYAGENPGHSVPTLKSQAKTTVTTQGNTLTVTFGPLDPVPHHLRYRSRGHRYEYPPWSRHRGHREQYVGQQRYHRCHPHDWSDDRQEGFPVIGWISDLNLQHTASGDAVEIPDLY